MSSTLTPAAGRLLSLESTGGLLEPRLAGRRGGMPGQGEEDVQHPDWQEAEQRVERRK